MTDNTHQIFRKARRAQDLTLAEMAASLNVSAQRLHQWEKGEPVPVERLHDWIVDQSLPVWNRLLAYELWALRLQQKQDELSAQIARLTQCAESMLSKNP